MVGGGSAPDNVCERGLSPPRRTTTARWAESDREGSISPLSSARSCSENERSRLIGVGELSARRSSPLPGDSSSWQGDENTTTVYCFYCHILWVTQLATSSLKSFQSEQEPHLKYVHLLHLSQSRSFEQDARTGGRAGPQVCD